MTDRIEIRPRCTECGHLSDVAFSGSDYLQRVKPQIIRAGWTVRVEAGRKVVRCPRCSAKGEVVTVP